MPDPEDEDTAADDAAADDDDADADDAVGLSDMIDALFESGSPSPCK